MLALSDMEIMSALTPAYFERHLDVLNAASVVVLDANLPEKSLRYLADHVTAPYLLTLCPPKKQ